jgi:peroxiredoxin
VQSASRDNFKVVISRYRLAALAAALALVIAGCSRSTSESKVRPDSERKPAPEFELKDANGATVRLSDYRGKVVLLNFWATWCGPCEVEIPWFIEFEQKYKDRNFAVLGVSFDDDGWKSVRPYIASHKINYRIMVGSDKLGEQYGGVDSLPTTFIIDREGRIAAHHVGLIDKADYQNEILKLLDGSKASAAPAGSAGGLLAGILRPGFRADVRTDGRP